jgi:hypothetical protein
MAERGTAEPPNKHELEALLGQDAQLAENLGLSSTDCADMAATAPATLGGVTEAVVRRWVGRNGIEPADSALVKLGRLIEFADAALEADRSAQMVFIVRDPRAVVRSMHRSQPPRGSTDATFSLGNPYFAVRMWRRRLQAYERAKARYGDRVTAVRFEELGDDKEIDRLVNFVGPVPPLQAIPFAVSEREQTLHTKVDDSFDLGLNRQWRDDLSARTVRNIEALCHDELGRWGYSQGVTPSAPALVAAHAAATVARPKDIGARVVRRLKAAV